MSEYYTSGCDGCDVATGDEYHHGYEVHATAKDPETAALIAEALNQRAAERSWRCFHCDDVFTSERDAREHFGGSMGALAACQIKAGAERGLLQRLREAEESAAEAWDALHAESSDAMKAMAAQSSRHFQQLQTAEEAGYERGLRDGLALPPEERAKVYAEV